MTYIDTQKIGFSSLPDIKVIFSIFKSEKRKNTKNKMAVGNQQARSQLARIKKKHRRTRSGQRSSEEGYNQNWLQHTRQAAKRPQPRT